jgi:hypothetical protein
MSIIVIVFLPCLLSLVSVSVFATVSRTLIVIIVFFFLSCVIGQWGEFQVNERKIVMKDLLLALKENRVSRVCE